MSDLKSQGDPAKERLSDVGSVSGHAPSFKLTKEQIDDIEAVIPEGDVVGKYTRAYQKIIDINNEHKKSGLPTLDESTLYWFRKAREINANRPNSAANVFIREVSAGGIIMDGRSVGDLQHTSNLIGGSVINDIETSHQVPPIDKFLQADISNSLQHGGQKIEGWGGAFYYWNTPYRKDKDGKDVTVGQDIMADPVKYDEFITINAKAAADAEEIQGPFASAVTASHAQAPLEVKADIALRLKRARTTGNYVEDPNSVDGYQRREDGTWIFPVDPEVDAFFPQVLKDPVKASQLNAVRDFRLRALSQGSFPNLKSIALSAGRTGLNTEGGERPSRLAGASPATAAPMPGVPQGRAASADDRAGAPSPARIEGEAAPWPGAPGSPPIDAVLGARGAALLGGTGPAERHGAILAAIHRGDIGFRRGPEGRPGDGNPAPGIGAAGQALRADVGRPVMLARNGASDADRPLVVSPRGGRAPDWMDDRSKRELAGVNAPLARDLLSASEATGLHFRITQGLRTQAEADANARSGRGVRNSQHLWGAAADIVMQDAQGHDIRGPDARRAYQRFADAFEAHSRATGGHARWLGNLSGRWGRDIVHFDQGIGYGQTHERDPFGAGGPTEDDIRRGNQEIFNSRDNPFLRKGLPLLRKGLPLDLRPSFPMLEQGSPYADGGRHGAAVQRREAERAVLPGRPPAAAPAGAARHAGVDVKVSGLDDLREAHGHIDAIHRKVAGLGGVNLRVRHEGFGDRGERPPVSMRTSLNGAFSSDGRAIG